MSTENGWVYQVRQGKSCYLGCRPCAQEASVYDLRVCQRCHVEPHMGQTPNAAVTEQFS